MHILLFTCSKLSFVSHLPSEGIISYNTLYSLAAPNLSSASLVNTAHTLWSSQTQLFISPGRPCSSLSVDLYTCCSLQVFFSSFITILNSPKPFQVHLNTPPHPLYCRLTKPSLQCRSDVPQLWSLSILYFSLRALLQMIISVTPMLVT